MAFKDRFNVTILCLCFLATSPLLAVEIPWKTPSYQQIATNRSVVEVLRDFAGDQGIGIVISDKVAGNVSGKFGPMSPGKFLECITQSTGLVWYYDGQSLYVYRSDEIQTQVTQLRYTTVDKLLESLKRLDILSNRFPMKTIPEDRVLYITAPPHYLELVGKTVEMLERNGQSRAGSDVAVGVYRLRHAWADDHTFFLQDRQIAVPGVATILRNVLAKRQRQKQDGPAVKPQPQSRPGLMGKGLAASGHQPQADLPASLQPGQNSDSPNKQTLSREAADADEASIQADPRLNAVIVRDVREKLPAYESIIQSLDQPGGLVEITANMIDITVTKGLDWAPPDLAKWRSNGKDYVAQFSLTGSSSSAAQGNLIASLTGDGVTQFFSSITLLEKDNRAHVVARPSILTINNVEACLTNTETVYVKVAGAYATDLYNVVVGTTLQITPHIIQTASGNQVQLVVDLKDGNFDTTETVDNIPRVKQNTITTQAVLSEGCSLLVGGLRRTEKKHVEHRIPWLGTLPLVGYLFKTTSDSSIDYDRVVLISPRIIDIPQPQPHGQQAAPTDPVEVIPTPSPMPNLSETGFSMPPSPDSQQVVHLSSVQPPATQPSFPRRQP